MSGLLAHTLFRDCDICMANNLHTRRNCTGPVDGQAPRAVRGEAPAYRKGWADLVSLMSMHGVQVDGFGDLVALDMGKPIAHCPKLDIAADDVHPWLRLAAMQEQGIVSAFAEIPEYAAGLIMAIRGQVNALFRFRMDARERKAKA